MRWIAPALVAGLLSLGCGDGLVAPPDAASQDITAISVSPLALSPPFSPSVHDYVIHCAQGVNPVTLSVTDGAGTATRSLDLVEGQLTSVRDRYYIRCLPHDFPALTTTTHPDVGDATPGWYLVNSKSFAIVLDGNGTPVWYRRATNMIDVGLEAPNTITYMPDQDLVGFNYTLAPAFDVESLATSTVATVRAVGSPTDLHELQPLPDGGHVLLSYVIQPHVDLTGLGSFGSDETIANCELQVVDKAGHLVWSWLATDHVDPVTESIEPAVDMVDNAPVVDLFHCNSVDVDLAGNFLLSMRHANAVLYIDRTTGTIRWKLGGSAVNKDGAPHLAVEGDPETTFVMQHDVRWTIDGGITMFDNHSAGRRGRARGVEYALDLAHGHATFVSQHLGTAPSGYEGSYRRYADGDEVISWGATTNEVRVVTEYGPAGKVVLEIAMPGEVSYRAIKVPASQLDIALLRATGAG